MRRLVRLANFRLAIPPCVCGVPREELVTGTEVERYRDFHPAMRLRKTRCAVCGSWEWVRAIAYQNATEIVEPAAVAR